MRTWKMEAPPEIVAGIVMNVITSCSLRPARRARNPPMAWMPSCELPAIRITASLILDTFGAPSDDDAPAVALLIKGTLNYKKNFSGKVMTRLKTFQGDTVALSTY